MIIGQVNTNNHTKSRYTFYVKDSVEQARNSWNLDVFNIIVVGYRGIE